MKTRRCCRECGTELAPKDAQGLCPRCLLQVGLGSRPETLPTGASSPGAAQPRPLPETGSPFGRYQILRRLGRGGMGVVYEAEEVDTGRRVALKVLGQQFDSPQDRARFLREGRLAASINHPNCVYVYGTDDIEDTPVISMELVAGGTLQQRVKQHGPLPAGEAVDVILQIINGLEAAQAIGILHRDVKPANCFEDDDGAVKIGDFGLSISTAGRAEPTITTTGKMVGTPAFCSPEQLRGEELNERSDQYAVGATLFYLLTGRVPFEGSELAHLVANTLEKPAPSPRQFRVDVPKGLANVVLRCLRKQPADRFKNYQELRQALSPFTSSAPTPATLGLRTAAGLADHCCLAIVSVGLLLLLRNSPMRLVEEMSRGSAKGLGFAALSLLNLFLYFTLFEGLGGATPGKYFCGLRVVGPDKNPPGLGRAAVRALIYSVLPVLPYWTVLTSGPHGILQWSAWAQTLLGLTNYLIIGLLFSTARRRNGYAAMHDLLTYCRVISHTALASRPVLATIETQPAGVEHRPQCGPYNILESLGKSGAVEWFLGYDLRLLRKVWIRVVPPGTPPVPPALRGLGRASRLRWLTGRRTAGENWDAFEGVSGQPLSSLIEKPQPWRHVRFWLFDLARELDAATRDGSLPEVLALDRVWITEDGRAKLLDFPAPGLDQPDGGCVGVGDQPQRVRTIENAAAGTLTPPTAAVLPPQTAEAKACQFLGWVAAAALQGRPGLQSANATDIPVPLPIHARDFLQSLPRLADPEAVTVALQPLLHKIAEVTRGRRAAIVAGCLAIPLMTAAFMPIMFSTFKDLDRDYPGLMTLNSVLQARSITTSRLAKNAPHPTEQQFAIFISSHFRSFITNDAVWNAAMPLTLIKGAARQFAERSVATHPAPSAEEIADAEKAVGPWAPKVDPFASFQKWWMPLATAAFALLVYVALPALIAALCFRGGLVLLAAGVTFVRRDGRRASRGRLLWRALVAWGPTLLVLPVGIAGFQISKGTWLVPMLLASVMSILLVVSLALPKRGLADRLAGTWPVPR